MLTKFAELAEKIKEEITLDVDRKDCKAAGDLLEILSNWYSKNCPIIQPVEIITDPVEK